MRCHSYLYRNTYCFNFAVYLPHCFSVTTEFQNKYVQNCNKEQENHFWQGRYTQKYCQGESPHYAGKESIVSCVTWKFIHCFICSTGRNDNYWTAGIGIPNPRHTADLEKTGEARRAESQIWNKRNAAAMGADCSSLLTGRIWLWCSHPAHCSNKISPFLVMFYSVLGVGHSLFIRC